MTKLTKQAIEKAFKAKLSVTLWDDKLKGFAFRVSSKGKGTWLIVRRLGEGGRMAKQVWYAFGSYPGMDLDKATTEYHKLIASISDGINPQIEKRKRRNKQHQAYATGKLKDVYLQWYEKHRADDWETPGSYWYEVGRRFKVEVLPKLGEQTIVSEISKQDITTLIDNKERATQSGARQVFNAMRPFFKWMLSRELIPFDPMDGLKPPDTSEARDRILTPCELVLVWKASDSLSYPWGPFYKLLILTAQRRDEVAGIMWAEQYLFGSDPRWIIPGRRTKNGMEHLVHLCPQAQAILQELGRMAPRDAGNQAFKFPFTFTTTGATPISGFSKAKAYLDKKITELNGKKPIPAWHIHDLRRTAATGMASLGVPPHIVERVLNHISAKDVGGLTGIYQRFQYAEERKKALADWSNHIGMLVSEDMREKYKPENVVALRM